MPKKNWKSELEASFCPIFVKIVMQPLIKKAVNTLKVGGSLQKPKKRTNICFVLPAGTRFRP